MTELYERLQHSAAALAQRTGCNQHDVVVGLGGYPEGLSALVGVPYSQREGFAISRSRRQSATREGMQLREGVYVWFRGPMFETPAEIRMARILGGSLVGMSTVPEATAARHMGADVLGISVCTNLAAGISEEPLSHTEVMQAATEASGRFSALFDELLPTL